MERRGRGGLQRHLQLFRGNSFTGKRGTRRGLISLPPPLKGPLQFLCVLLQFLRVLCVSAGLRSPPKGRFQVGTGRPDRPPS